MYQSLGQSSKSFLTEPAWRELPWSSPKSHFDELLDILLELPDLFAHSDELPKSTSPPQRLRGSLLSIRQAYQMESQLSDWFASFEASTSGALYYPELSKFGSVTENLELGKVFPVAFHFSTFAVAQHMLYYWIGLIIVQAHLCFTYKELSHFMATLDPIRDALPCTCFDTDGTGADDGFPTNCLQHFEMKLLPPLGHRFDWPQTIARNVGQSMEYFLEDGLPGFGSASALPALAVVKGYWEALPGDWSRELTWAEDMFSRISATGYEIAKAIWSTT
jgi:hypothetical protein